MHDINWVYVPPVIVAVSCFIAAGLAFWLIHRDEKRRQQEDKH